MPAAKPTPLQHYLLVQQKVDREMAKILLTAAKEAEAIVLANAGKAGAGSAYETARMKQASKALRESSAAMWGNVNSTLKVGMKRAAEAAVNSETFVNDALQSAFGARIPALEQAFAYNAANAVEAVYAKAQNGIPLASQVYRTNALADGRVDKVLHNGILLQQSARQIAANVKGLINPNTPGGVSYAANRLARTELNNAFHTSQVHRRADEPWTEGFKWHLSGSHPKPDECNEYATSVNFKGGEPGVFKPDQVPGKPHPQCLCHITTVTVSEDQFVEDFLAGKHTAYMDKQIYSSGVGTVC